MNQAQIRLTRTPDINKVLSFLRSKYQLLSEAEIIKVALSEKYNQEVSENEKPSEYLIKTLKQARKNRKEGKGSPVFDNAEDAIAYLEKQGI